MIKTITDLISENTVDYENGKKKFHPCCGSKRFLMSKLPFCALVVPVPSIFVSLKEVSKDEYERIWDAMDKNK